MLKHRFFVDFSAVPLASFFAIAKRLSKPEPEPEIAFIKNIGKLVSVALPGRKVKTG